MPEGKPSKVAWRLIIKAAAGRRLFFYVVSATGHNRRPNSQSCALQPNLVMPFAVLEISQLSERLCGLRPRDIFMFFLRKSTVFRPEGAV
jgi:hypothetical protein